MKFLAGAAVGSIAPILHSHIADRRRVRRDLERIRTSIWQVNSDAKRDARLHELREFFLENSWLFAHDVNIRFFWKWLSDEEIEDDVPHGAVFWQNETKTAQLERELGSLTIMSTVWVSLWWRCTWPWRKIQEHLPKQRRRVIQQLTASKGWYPARTYPVEPGEVIEMLVCPVGVRGQVRFRIPNRSEIGDLYAPKEYIDSRTERIGAASLAS